MSSIKTSEEIEVMTQGGKLLAKIRDRLLNEVKEGGIPLEIDNLAKKLIKEAGGSPSFVTVGDYKWATCICVNDVVVHGVPTSQPFKTGDVVGIDVGLLYKGYHTDTSWTKIVESTKWSASSEIKKFLKTGEIALEKAISQARTGNRIGHVSKIMGDTVTQGGYFVVEHLVGHGIGTKLHEPPQIPGILTQPIERTPLIKSGMTVALEVIYTMNKTKIVYGNDDGWTLQTADGCLAGLFEQTILVTDSEPVVLTQS